jgi:trimeric autotransporter adhesin
LGSNSVTNLKIINNAVTNSKIATDAITNIKIADGAVTASKLGAGIVVAQTIAANAVNGTHIQLGSDAAGDTMYYNGTDYIRLAAGTAGQVLSMNAGATAPEWAADSSNVGGTAVGGDVTGTVSNITIPVGSITSAMLGLDVIVAEDIANNAITFAELADNAVKTAKIENNAVDGTKIAMGSDVTGDILYYDGTNYIRLGAGSNDQVLTVSSGVPSWAAAAAGGGGGGVSAAEATATAVTMAVALG